MPAAARSKVGKPSPVPGSARSPRSGPGNSLALRIHVVSALPPGKIRAATCGSATTSHSSPLAACTVRIWTRCSATSIRPGSSPFSMVSAVSRKASRPGRLAPGRSAYAVTYSAKASRCSRPVIAPRMRRALI
ncbi:Uncharacterised protein [Mycobacteroides abscessus subsp. abscessus]|nr:Uncharacterised protein [Mycobacteroides abscessus subsp. abscessus]